MQLRPYAAADEHAVVELWRRCELTRPSEARLTARGCPKLNIQVRASNQAVLEFYRKIGYSVDEAVSLGKRLIPDSPPR